MFPFSEFSEFVFQTEIEEEYKFCRRCGLNCLGKEGCFLKENTFQYSKSNWKNQGKELKEAISSQNLRPSLPQNATNNFFFLFFDFLNQIFFFF